MLVLSMRRGKRIWIDGPVVIELVGFTTGGDPKIGFYAPLSTNVSREETKHVPDTDWTLLEEIVLEQKKRIQAKEIGGIQSP